MHFQKQRDKELLAAYRRALARHKYIIIENIAIEAVNSPCSRFWVSEDRALFVISEMLKGKPILEGMNPNKREMFEEIFRRVQAMLMVNPIPKATKKKITTKQINKSTNQNLTLADLVFMAVNSPAPKFYYQPRTLCEYIHRIHRKNKQKQTENN